MIGSINASYISKLLVLNAGSTSLSTNLLINKKTFSTLSQVIDTSLTRKVVDNEDIDTVYFEFRNPTWEYKVKWKCDVQYFEDLWIANSQNRIIEERMVRKQILRTFDYESNGEQSSVESNFNTTDSEEIESINISESLDNSEFLRSQILDEFPIS
jgi:hypothetical protein